jgi:hypothetical protein
MPDATTQTAASTRHRHSGHLIVIIVESSVSLKPSSQTLR